jgi:hypothetical protein
MSHITDPATHWRARAQEMRSIANAMPGLARAIVGKAAASEK